MIDQKQQNRIEELYYKCLKGTISKEEVDECFELMEVKLEHLRDAYPEEYDRRMIQVESVLKGKE